MSATFYEDLDALCQTPVVDFSHAVQVLDVLAELISDEFQQFDEEYRGVCCGKFVNSSAYKYDLERSHKQLLDWLLNADKLHTQRLLFVGSVVLHDLESMVHVLHSEEAVSAVTGLVWMYRFTEPEVVNTFLLVLYGILVHGQLEEAVLDNFSLTLLHFLYKSVCGNDSSREPLLVLVALNDQYMLHDRRDDDNLVFAALKSAPSQYCAIGSSIVLTLNRCSHEDQDLKIFICKFLYLIFMTPSTADLLYTNDLTVFAEIMIRELNDLPLEAVEVRAMYLRVLYAMLKHSPIEYSGPHLRSSLVQVLRLTIQSAENLGEEDREEIDRLAERCLEVPWLNWRNVDFDAEQDAEQDTESAVDSLEPILFGDEQQQNLVNALERGSFGSISVQSLPIESPNKPLTAGSRRPIPPPPPPVPRHHSVASIASSDSRTSYDNVVHFRPPPPLPRKR